MRLFKRLATWHPHKEAARHLHREIDENGYAIIRGLVPRSRVEQYLTALDSVYDRFRREPEHFSEEDRTGLAIGNVSPLLFRNETGLDMLRYFNGTIGIDLLGRMLGNSYRHFNSTFLSVAQTPTSTLQAAFQWHTDGIVQGTKENVAVFWSPLHNCGRTAPGLAVIPANRERVLDHYRVMFPTKEFPGWFSTTEWNSSPAFRADTLAEEFPPPVIPELEPGDVIAFTNATIHASYVTPQMKQHRSAIVMRWAA